MSTSRWEISLVLLTAMGHFLLAGWLDLQLAYVVGACFFWTGFVAIRAKRNASVLAAWGFTTRKFGRSLVLLMPVLFLAVCGFVGTLRGLLVSPKS